MTDKWAQRLIATAILIAAVSLLVGTGSFAWKEVASTKAPFAQAKR